MREGVYLSEDNLEKKMARIVSEVGDWSDWDFTSPEDKAAEKLKQTKSIPGQGFRFGPSKGKEGKEYSGKSQNFYNTAITSIQGLMKRQPQLAPQLTHVLQALKQTFTSQVKRQMPEKQVNQERKPIGRRAASSVPGAAPASTASRV